MVPGFGVLPGDACDDAKTRCHSLKTPSDVSSHVAPCSEDPCLVVPHTSGVLCLDDFIWPDVCPFLGGNSSQPRASFLGVGLSGRWGFGQLGLDLCALPSVGNGCQLLHSWDMDLRCVCALP